MLLLDMAYRLLREFRQAFTRLDTPPFSNRRHPGSDIALLDTIAGQGSWVSRVPVLARITEPSMRLFTRMPSFLCSQM